tara:strand:+ start:262 stop:924 length:663 start_codon:yes stop_codon:yes gene_type:complete
MFKIYTILFILINFVQSNQLEIPGSFSIVRLQYDGGGDWYSDPSSLYNLLNYVNNNSSIIVNLDPHQSKVGEKYFNENNYFYLTGHGNITFNDKEIYLLREKLINGSFLHADDNYGMDKSFRREIKKIFPEKVWVELPLSHAIFDVAYKFPNGLPKIHEHDNQRPQALAIFHNKKILILYTYESDLGDGWEDISTHNISLIKHEQALKMGTNIIIFHLTQ